MAQGLWRISGVMALCIGLVAPAARAQAITPQPNPAPPAAGPPSPENDVELTRPLTPLEQFQVAPPRATAPAAKPLPSVSYDLEVRGLESVGLERDFRRLSTLQSGRGKAVSELQINARVTDDKELIARLLRSQGYYQGQAEITIEPETTPGRYRVVVTAVPGQLFHFASVSVSGPDTDPRGLARNALTLNPGDPIVAQKVEAAEANVALALPQHGYPFAKVGQRDIALNPTDAKGAYNLPVTPGPKSSFGAFRVHEPVFTAEHLAVIGRFKPLELYDSRKIDDFRGALVATNLFSTVAVSPVDTGRMAPDGTRIADLDVRGAAAPSRTLSGSLGYETGAGVKAEAAWTALNLFPPEGALTLRGVAGSQEQLFGVQFRRANAGRRDRTITAGVETSREDTDAFTAYTGAVRASVARATTPLWQKRWTYSAGVEAELSREQAFSLALGRQAYQTYKIAGLRLAAGYDRSDSVLNPTRGFQILTTLDPEAEFSAAGRGFVKTTVEGRIYVPAMQALVLAGRLRVGAIFGIDAQDLAPTRRFYEGGGDTIRGFSFQKVGPKAPDGTPLGGVSATNFTTEARYRFGNFGVVTFVDGGQVYETRTPRFADLRYGVGIGARYYTNFGPIRIDIATPISRRSGEGAIGVYISIGQAF
jgi:translocation and assembly module TamA